MAKLMLNLQRDSRKKRPVAVLGETRPVYPDKGCVGEVLGFSIPPIVHQPGWLNGADD
jgi:hypothetical protein